jgi:hypothetical protein
MLNLALTGRVAVAATLAAVATGCAASNASPPAAIPAPQKVAATRAATRPASVTRIDALTNVARRRYAIESHGAAATAMLHRVAGDPVLLRTLRSGDLAGTRAYVRRRFAATWYHMHVSRMRIMQGSRVVVDAGVPFVVAPSQTTLRGTGGHSLATLQVSIQDVIGFVRYMHRNYPVDVVVRGSNAGHVRTSLPAAAYANLPSQGPVSIAGHRYSARSFHETALAGEPVTVWILTKG